MNRARKREKADPWAAECPSRGLIELLASKWVLLLELMRSIGGISQKMLTETLRRLESVAC